MNNIIAIKNKSPAQKKAIERSFLRGELQKIYPGIYTSNTDDSLAVITANHALEIAGYIYPKSVISFKAGMDLRNTLNHVTCVYPGQTKSMNVHGVQFDFIHGKNALDSDMPLLNVFVASPARLLIDNMRSKGRHYACSNDDIQFRLIHDFEMYGREYLMKLNDQVNIIGTQLNAVRSAFVIQNMIHDIIHCSAISEYHWVSQYNNDKIPCERTMKPIITLASVLLTFQSIEYAKEIKNNPQIFASFESYFSNYIEGTQFSIGDAMDIMREPPRSIYERHDDSHDVLSLFQIAQQSKEVINPIEWIKDAHKKLMQHHTDIQAGQFKSKSNQAGSTLFTHPNRVCATLDAGFNLISRIDNPVAKALLAKFVITQVHPFQDGNGRISRLLMNAILQDHGIPRIIVPTVMREDYLNGLRRLSRKGDPSIFIQVMQQAQTFTDSIDFSSYDRAMMDLNYSNAFSDDVHDHIKILNDHEDVNDDLSSSFT